MSRFVSAFALVLLAWPSQLLGAEFEQQIGPILRQYCQRCHGPEKAQGDFRVDTLTTQFAERENAQAWIEVRDRLNRGEMPPEDQPQPDARQITNLSHWITHNLRAAERAALSSGGRVLLRRMNRHEYTNTVSDLLHMKFPVGESPLDVLPPDGTAEGFDKVSAALLLDPSLMELYYRVARRIAQRAIVDGPPEFPTEKMRLEFEEIPNSRAIGYLVTRLGMNPVPGGLELIEGGTRSFGMLQYPGRRDNNVAPVNGFYRFTVKAGGAKGADGEVPRMLLTHNHPDLDSQKILEVNVTAPWDQPEEYSVVLPRDTLGGELNVKLVNETKLYMGQRPGENFMRRSGEVGKRGDFATTIRLAGRKTAEGWGGDRSTPDPEKLDVSKYPRLMLDYLEVEGPLYDQWPPRSHTMLLTRGDDAAETLEYAREIFEQFLPHAWRRPITAGEVEPILQVVGTELDNGQTFHDAIRTGLATALTSPKFLYLVEPTRSAPATDPRPLNDYELASRLSYFLWSSMPDETLFRLAESGKLNDSQVMSEQVDRMLADPKIERVGEGFARQWLRTDTFLAFAPDRNLYRDFDTRLKEAITREPLEFFRTVLTKDLSVLNFIDSEFLVINDRLAEHYGLTGVEGENFRRVELPTDSPRGGLLGMAGVHLAGSDGQRTKPVSRAVYVREVLFNDPPDPPPANVGEIEPNIRGERLTVRERLIQHQQIESCAACHRALDPYGLALENFNVIGSWRENQDGEDFRGSQTPAIDSSGVLPGGINFATFAEYREVLLQQDNRFRRALAEKLLVFALGRPIEPSDDSTLQQAVDTMTIAKDALQKDATNNDALRKDTLRALIQSLVHSQPFRTK